MIEKELISWLRLLRTQGIGEVTFYSLLEIYGTIEKALENLPSLARNVKKNLLIATEAEVIQEIEEVEKFGAKLITILDDSYSPLLRQIKDCPPVLTVFGNYELLKKEAIAIVGARAASLNSCKFAYKLAKDLAELGFNIVSGLACGIDAAAHKIIYEGFATTAVMATGINIIYPKENINLHKEMTKKTASMAKGLVISEIPFNVKAKPQYFSRRNRIISGLSNGVILIEAGLNSGSLITAKYALAHGRPLFAVPGSPINERYRGSNALLKEGAILLEQAQDVTKALKSQNAIFDYKTLAENNKDYASMHPQAKKINSASAINNSSPISTNAAHINNLNNDINKNNKNYEHIMALMQAAIPGPESLKLHNQFNPRLALNNNDNNNIVCNNSDIINSININDSSNINNGASGYLCKSIENFQNIEREETKARILQLLDYNLINTDFLLANLEMPTSLSLLALIELELEEKITRYEGNHISLAYHG